MRFRTLLRRSRFALDFLALLSSRSIAQVLTIAVGLALVRIMADPAFGAYSLATTTIGLAGVVADFGLDVILTREIAADRQLAPMVMRSAIGLRIVLAATTTIGLVFVALMTPAIGRPDLLLIGGLSLAPRGVMRAITAALTGFGRVRDAALIEGIGAVASSVATLILVFADFTILGDRAAGAIWGLVVGSAFGLIAALRIALRVSRPRLLNRLAGFSPWSWLLFAAAPFMIVSLAGAAFQSLDIYVVKVFYWRAGQPDAVALYAAPFRVLSALLLVPTAWGVVALPRYVRYGRRPKALRMALRRDLALTMAVGTLLSAACTLLAYPVTAIVLGPTYTASARVLAVLGWMTLPVCLSAPLIAVLTAMGHQARIALSVIAAGAIAVAANVLIGATADGRGIVNNLVIVATVKVASMALLLLFYWWAYWRARSGSSADGLRSNGHAGHD